MRTLEFIGTVRSNNGKFSREMVLPGRHELIVAPDDWPDRLVPGTLNIEIDDFPEGLDDVGEGDGLKKLDKGTFRAALIIPQRKITGNTIKPMPDEPTRGFAQVWRANLEAIASGQASKCWMLRRIGSNIVSQIELVADQHLRSALNLSDGAAVKVTAWEAESKWKPRTPDEIITEWCEAAEDIEAEYGCEKAMGYLLGEKLLNFLEAAEHDFQWREAIPRFVAEIKNLFEPWQISEFLNMPRRLGALGHVADDESHRMLRESLEESERIHEDARILLLLEWAKELLLEEPGQ